jgi:hypothetical protein
MRAWEGKCGFHCQKHIEQLKPSMKSGKPFLCMKHMRSWWRRNYGNMLSETDLRSLYGEQFPLRDINLSRSQGRIPFVEWNATLLLLSAPYTYFFISISFNSKNLFPSTLSSLSLLALHGTFFRNQVIISPTLQSRTRVCFLSS